MIKLLIKRWSRILNDIIWDWKLFYRTRESYLVILILLRKEPVNIASVYDLSEEKGAQIIFENVKVITNKILVECFLKKKVN